MLFASAIANTYLLKTADLQNLEKTTIWYFWLVSLPTIAIAFVEGGLFSFSIMLFPMIALHIWHKMFIYIFLLLLHGHTDSLTDLSNRTYANTRFAAMQNELDSGIKEMGLYFTDMKNSKAINDFF